jgi:N-formylglutamate amidohydrolase
MKLSLTEIRAAWRCLTALAVLLGVAGAPAQVYLAGTTNYGRSNYIEYIAGNMPLIIAAPHGGSLQPAELPDRTTNAPWTNTVLGTDAATELLARAMQRAITNRFGRQPHVILCRLDREKIDCNREIGEGAQGHPLTEISWNEYQEFIEAAKHTVSNEFGAGLFIDLHGHGHTLQRLELGYLLSSSELNLSDNTLNNNAVYANTSSIRELNQRSPFTFAQLLRGTNSLGSLLASNGYPSVPSTVFPDPDGNPYFNGGYCTDRHGSIDHGTISALQIECNFTNVRDSTLNRALFATNLAESLESFFTQHFGLTLAQGPPVLGALSNRLVNPGQTLAFTNTATDTDAPAQIFAWLLTQFPPGAAIQSSTGVFTWRPSVTNAGSTNPVTVRVTDNGTPNLSAARQFFITVNPLTNPAVTQLAPATFDRVRLTITGGAGPDYTVQGSINLANWTNLFTTNAPAVPFEWTDNTAGSFLRRFYRVVVGP